MGKFRAKFSASGSEIRVLPRRPCRRDGLGHSRGASRRELGDLHLDVPKSTCTYSQVPKLKTETYPRSGGQYDVTFLPGVSAEETEENFQRKQLFDTMLWHQDWNANWQVQHDVVGKHRCLAMVRCSSFAICPTYDVGVFTLSTNGQDYIRGNIMEV